MISLTINFLTLTREELLRLVAAFIFGIICGSAALNLIVGPRLDNLIFTNKELENKVQNQTEKLEKLEESLAQERRDVVKDIEVRLDSELDKHIAQEIEAELFQIVKNLIGKDLTKIDPEPLVEALDQRIVILDDKEYQLNLVWFILKQETVIQFKIDD